MDVDPLDAVGLHVFEREPREITGARADAAQGVLGYTLHGEGAQKLVVVPLVVGDPHVFDGGVVRPGEDLHEVKVLRVAGHGCPRVLQRAQLHLGLEGVGRELVPVAGVLEVGALAEQAGGVPEGDEGAEQLREGSCHRDVVGGAAGGDAGDLRVHRGISEDEAAARQEDLLVAFVQCRVQGDLAGEDAHVLDGVIRRALAGAQGVGGLCELQLEHQVQLGRQELARLEHPDERGRHQHVLETLRGHGCRRAGVIPEARDALVPVPFGGLE